MFELRSYEIVQRLQSNYKIMPFSLVVRFECWFTFFHIWISTIYCWEAETKTRNSSGTGKKSIDICDWKKKFFESIEILKLANFFIPAHNNGCHWKCYEFEIVLIVSARWNRSDASRISTFPLFVATQARSNTKRKKIKYEYNSLLAWSLLLSLFISMKRSFQTLYLQKCIVWACISPVFIFIYLDSAQAHPFNIAWINALMVLIEI